MGEKIILHSEKKERDIEIFSSEKTIEVVEDLGDALNSDNELRVQELLKNKYNWDNAITRRGEGAKFMGPFREGFDFLLSKEFSNLPYFRKLNEKASIFNVEGREMIRWLNENGLGTDVLQELLCIAFHQRDDASFFRILSIIFENKNLIDDVVINRAKHHLASWQSSVEKNKGASLNLNEEVFKEAEEKGDLLFAPRAKYGIAYNADIKPRKKGELFLKIQERFKSIGDDFNAIQALNGAGRSYFELAQNQMSMISDSKRKETYGQIKSQADDNLYLAKELALEALKRALSINYPNAEIKARELLGDIYDKMQDSKKARSFRKKSSELREIWDYRTK